MAEHWSQHLAKIAPTRSKTPTNLPSTQRPSGFYPGKSYTEPIPNYKATLTDRSTPRHWVLSDVTLFHHKRFSLIIQWLLIFNKRKLLPNNCYRIFSLYLMRAAFDTRTPSGMQMGKSSVHREYVYFLTLHTSEYMYILTTDLNNWIVAWPMPRFRLHPTKKKFYVHH